MIFPDAWEHYLAAIPAEEHEDLMSAYHRRLTSDDEATRRAAAKAWSIWEASTSFLTPRSEHVQHASGDDFSLAFARIECHYFTNGGFFEQEEQILNNVDKIRHIPTVIIQGRYDVVCPMQSAWELHKKWPEADFRVIGDSGHSACEISITSELIAATDRFAG